MEKEAEVVRYQTYEWWLDVIERNGDTPMAWNAAIHHLTFTMPPKKSDPRLLAYLLLRDEPVPKEIREQLATLLLPPAPKRNQIQGKQSQLVYVSGKGLTEVRIRAFERALSYFAYFEEIRPRYSTVNEAVLSVAEKFLVEDRTVYKAIAMFSNIED